jgi:hypothetical protein
VELAKTRTIERVTSMDNWAGSGIPADLGTKRGKPQEEFPKFDVSGRAQINNRPETSNLGEGNPFVVKWLRDLQLILVEGILYAIDDSEKRGL